MVDWIRLGTYADQDRNTALRPNTTFGSRTSPLDLKAQEISESVISDVKQIPSKPLYCRPDLRQVERQVEKLLTFETKSTELWTLRQSFILRRHGRCEEAKSHSGVVM